MPIGSGGGTATGPTGPLPMRLAGVRDETPSTRTFRLEPPSAGAFPAFRAGQHVQVLASLPHVLTSRPFSISSAPSTDGIELTVRLRGAGFVTRWLFQDAVPGTPFLVGAPEGGLVADDDAPAWVLLAGGAGVAPFVSMVRRRAAAGTGPRVVLIHGNQDRRDVPFADELAALAQGSGWLDYVPVLARPDEAWTGATGLLDAARIREAAGDLSDARFLVSGPPEMVGFALAQVKSLGVPRDRVRVESPWVATDAGRLPAWPVGLAPERVFRVRVEGGIELEAPAGVPLRDVLAEAGLEGAAACRFGECGRCRIRVLEGTVCAPPDARVLEDGPGGALLHACGAYPVTDVAISL